MPGRLTERTPRLGECWTALRSRVIAPGSHRAVGSRGLQACQSANRAVAIRPKVMEAGIRMICMVASDHATLPVRVCRLDLVMVEARLRNRLSIASGTAK